MFNKFLIVLVSVFAMGTCLFSQNTYGNNFVFDDSVNPTILKSSRSSPPEPPSLGILVASGTVVADKTFANYMMGQCML